MYHTCKWMMLSILFLFTLYVLFQICFTFLDCIHFNINFFLYNRSSFEVLSPNYIILIPDAAARTFIVLNMSKSSWGGISNKLATLMFLNLSSLFCVNLHWSPRIKISSYGNFYSALVYLLFCVMPVSTHY